MNPNPLRELLDAWDAQRSATSPDAADRLALARKALALGHPTLGCEMLRAPLADPGATPELRYTAALAQVRIGGYRAAAALVAGLLQQALPTALQVDVLALAGRIDKDRWARLPPGPEKDAALQRATLRYRQAWDLGRSSFPGINAATLLALAGQGLAARELAAQVRAAVERDPAQSPLWRAATRAEAAVLLGEFDVAAREYAEAVRLAGREVGHVASMRRQLRLIAASIRVPETVLEALAEPRVLVFTGHMIDAPGAAAPRFPPALEGAVAEALARRLDALQAGFGYVSAACGGDLLFIEAMQARGAEVHITLPFARDDFLATSVAFAGEAWVARFEAALQRAASLSFGVPERFLGDEALYAFAADQIQGAALLHARELEATPGMLALIDPDAAALSGGTAHTLARWERLGLQVERIDLAALRAAAAASVSTQPAPERPAVETRSAPVRREVRTMLFADVVGFSRLAEEDTPAFLLNFIGAIAELVARAEPAPAFVNTWGDGLFMVFDTAEQGADFALRLRDAVARTDWPAHGLPAGTSIRIGLHSGPVFPAEDPILRRRNYFGSHVVRAARIEPVAAPGSVYVSAEFARALAAGGDARFATDYLGVLPLAKGFGSGALYRLRRGDEAE